MSIWLLGVVVLAAGGVGGLVNALMTDNGFPLPRRSVTKDGTVIVRPGFLTNALVGGIAALVSWGLYGPLSVYLLIGTSGALGSNREAAEIGLSLASFAGAILIGIGGARWLSDQVDKALLRATASRAAERPQSSDAAARIAVARPANALKIADDMA
jgi:hypothetical protein